MQLTYCGQCIAATVVLASPNSHSLMLECDSAIHVVIDGVFQGMYLGFIVLLWVEERRRYEDIFHLQIAELVKPN